MRDNIKHATLMSDTEYQLAKAELLREQDPAPEKPSADMSSAAADSLALEELRLECLVRAGGDPDVVVRARRYLERRRTAADSSRYAVNVTNVHMEETSAASVFSLSLDVDVYASDEAIERDLIEHVMRHVHQWRSDRDSCAVAEIRRPEREIKQGSGFNIAMKRQFLRTYDMKKEGKSIKDIGEELFPGDKGDPDNVRQRVHQHIRTSAKLIKSAMEGDFPNKA